MARKTTNIPIPKCQCGKALTSGGYAANAPFLVAGRTPLCKDCLGKMYAFMHSVIENHFKALHTMCLFIDKAYDSGIAEKAIAESNDFSDSAIVFKEYMRLSSNKGRFKDGDTELFSTQKLSVNFEGNTEYTSAKNVEPDDDFEWTSDMEEKWADIWKSELDKRILWSHYQYCKQMYPEANELTLRDLALIHLHSVNVQNNAQSSAEALNVGEFTKLLDAYDKALKSAAVRGADKKKESNKQINIADFIEAMSNDPLFHPPIPHHLHIDRPERKDEVEAQFVIQTNMLRAAAGLPPINSMVEVVTEFGAGYSAKDMLILFEDKLDKCRSVEEAKAAILEIRSTMINETGDIPFAPPNEPFERFLCADNYANIRGKSLGELLASARAFEEEQKQPSKGTDEIIAEKSAEG